MAKRRLVRKPQLYGLPNALTDAGAPPIIEKRDPTSSDMGWEGQLWLNTTTQGSFICFGGTQWVSGPDQAGANFNSTVTINPGDLDVTTGDINVTAGNVTLGGDLTATGDVMGDDFVVGGDLSVTGSATLNGPISLNGDVTVAGDFDISSADALLIGTTSNTAPALTVLTNGGANETLVLQSAQGTGADSVQLTSSSGGIQASAASSVDIDAVTAFTLDAASFSIDSTTASNMTVTGASEDLTLSSVGGSVNISASEADAAAIFINASGGGIDIDAATTCDIDVTTDFTLDAQSFSIDSTTASNVTVTGASEDLTLSSVGGSLNLASSEADGAAIFINASGGGIDIDTATTCDIDVTTDFTLDAESFSIDSTTASNVTVTGASEDLTISSAGGSLAFTASEDVADAIVIESSGAASGIQLKAGTAGIDLDAAGFVSMTPATDSSATDTCIINAPVFSATYTGFTTAAAASQVFIITNSTIATTSAVILSASNGGANDAQMTVTRVEPKAGSIEITLTNNGAAALNGDVIITGWKIA